jgi:hypothetical protein
MNNDQYYFARCCDEVVFLSKLTWTYLLELKNEKVKIKCFPDAETLRSNASKS